MRYFIGFLITIGLIIILILLLFGGGDNSKKVPVTAKTLDSYAATDAAVRLTIDGPINAEQLHEQIRITVNKDRQTYEHIHGYNGDVVDSKSFANSQNGYANFLLALVHAGFNKISTNTDFKDERGYCALGRRYIFELIQADKVLQRSWSTSCGKPKTYLGSPNLTLQLFKAQIPGYDDLSGNVEL